MSFDVIRLARIAAGPFRQRDANRSVEHKMALELAVFGEKLKACENLRVTRVLYNAQTRVSAPLEVSASLAKVHQHVSKTRRSSTHERGVLERCLLDDSHKHLATTFHRSSMCTDLVLWIFKGPAWAWVLHSTAQDASRAVRTMLMRTGSHPSLPLAVVGLSGCMEWETLVYLARLPVCFTCGKEQSTSVCGDCKRQHYCSKKCMESDRERHKAICGRDDQIKVIVNQAVPADFRSFVRAHGAGGDAFCTSL